MEVMRGRIVKGRGFGFGRVTTRAKLVPLGMNANSMRIMAIHALDALVEHFALDEGTVNVNLVVNLSVNVIGGHLHVRSPWLNDFGQKVIEKGRTGMMSGMHEASAGMAFCTGLDLSHVCTVDIRQSKIRKTTPSLPRPGKLNVLTARSVTGFACDVHLGIDRGEGLGGGLKNLAQVGRMTISAHMIPVLHGTCPE